MSVSSVGGASSIVRAAFQQFTHDESARVANATDKSPANAGGGSDADTATIKLLKQQLADAQAKLREHERAKADEQTLRTDRQRVQAAASALAFAVERQAEEAKKAERAAQAARAAGGSAGGQYI